MWFYLISPCHNFLATPWSAKFNTLLTGTICFLEGYQGHLICSFRVIQRYRYTVNVISKLLHKIITSSFLKYQPFWSDFQDVTHVNKDYQLHQNAKNKPDRRRTPSYQFRIVARKQFRKIVVKITTSEKLKQFKFISTRHLFASQISSTVLYWIRNDHDWDTFVYNGLICYDSRTMASCLWTIYSCWYCFKSMFCIVINRTVMVGGLALNRLFVLINKTNLTWIRTTIRTSIPRLKFETDIANHLHLQAMVSIRKKENRERSRPDEDLQKSYNYIK